VGRLFSDLKGRGVPACYLSGKKRGRGDLLRREKGKRKGNRKESGTYSSRLLGREEKWRRFPRKKEGSIKKGAGRRTSSLTEKGKGDTVSYCLRKEGSGKGGTSSLLRGERKSDSKGKKRWRTLLSSLTRGTAMQGRAFLD